MNISFLDKKSDRIRVIIRKKKQSCLLFSLVESLFPHTGSQKDLSLLSIPLWIFIFLQISIKVCVHVKILFVPYGLRS